MEDLFLEHLSEIITIVINIVVVVSSYWRIVNRVTIMETKLADVEAKRVKELNDVEEKRLANVGFLKEIYDGKIEDAKKYAKGLFEIREGELREISKQLNELKARVDHQTEILNKSLSEMMVGMAEIRTHIKSCPAYQKKRDLERE